MPAPASSKSRPLRQRAWAWFGLVALGTLLVYARSCGAPFHFDDYIVIAAHEQGQLASAGQFVAFARTRLLPFATIAFNYWVGGEEAFGYHAVNLALHVATTFAVFALALALCATPRVRATWLAAQRLPFAFAAAALFALHPIQVQAVAYVIQRATEMAALGYIGAVALYLHGRNAQTGAGGARPALCFLGSGLCALGAFLSKENAASLPLAILLAEWSLYDRRGVGRRFVRLAPYFVLVLAIPFLWKLLAVGQGGRMVGGSPLEQITGLVRLLVFRASPGGDVSPLEYFYTQCAVIPRYLRLVVLPWGFNVDHDVAVQRAFSPAVAAGLTLLVGLLALGFSAIRRAPAAGFGIVWMFLALSVESSVLPIRDVMVEHRMYLAMAGIALAAGQGFAWLFLRRRSLAVPLGAAVVAVLAALTIQRNEVWRSPLALWSDALQRSPGKARVHVNVGVALQSAGRRQEAIDHYCRALALDPKNAQARANLTVASEEEAEAQIEAGDDIVLEGLPVGGAGTVRLAPSDPCRDR